MGERGDSVSASRLALLMIAAWLLPGAGHWMLGRRARAGLFAAIVSTSLVTGVLLQGLLYQPAGGQPLLSLAAFACMGVGAAYFVLDWGLGYTGDFAAAGFEYGKAFLLTAGLMNILLVIDVVDLARGEKD